MEQSCDPAERLTAVWSVPPILPPVLLNSSDFAVEGTDDALHLLDMVQQRQSLGGGGVYLDAPSVTPSLQQISFRQECHVGLHLGVAHVHLIHHAGLVGSSQTDDVSDDVYSGSST